MYHTTAHVSRGPRAFFSAGPDQALRDGPKRALDLPGLTSRHPEAATRSPERPVACPLGPSRTAPADVQRAGLEKALCHREVEAPARQGWVPDRRMSLPLQLSPKCTRVFSSTDATVGLTERRPCHGRDSHRRGQIRERGRSALLHGFVVMPNHYHVLLTLLGEHRIHEVIQRINSLSARRVNRLEGRRGRLWARRFHDHVVRNQDDFDECLQYIHENPRVGGLAEVSSAYPYSSAGYWEEAKSGGANSIRPEDPMAGASSLRLPSAQACPTGDRPSALPGLSCEPAAT